MCWTRTAASAVLLSTKGSVIGVTVKRSASSLQHTCVYTNLVMSHPDNRVTLRKTEGLFSATSPRSSLVITIVRQCAERLLDKRMGGTVINVSFYKTKGGVTGYD